MTLQLNRFRNSGEVSSKFPTHSRSVFLEKWEEIFKGKSNYSSILSKVRKAAVHHYFKNEICFLSLPKPKHVDKKIH